MIQLNKWITQKKENIIKNQADFTIKNKYNTILQSYLKLRDESEDAIASFKVSYVFLKKKCLKSVYCKNQPMTSKKDLFTLKLK